MASNSQNPLKFSNLKNNAIAFDQLQNSLFLPTLKEAIQNAKANIAKIKSNPAKPDFDNTILALETAGDEVDLVANIFHNQLSANTSDELQAISKEFGPLLAAYANDILLDDEIFARVKAVYENPGRELTKEEARLLDKYYSDFKRNGALLTPEQKEELRKIDAELAILAPQFAENVLKATNEFQLVLHKKEELKGLPEIVIAAAKQAAQDKGLKSEGDPEGPWLFTLHYPSVIPFLTYSENREAREKIWRANASKAYKDKYDNQEILRKTLQLRHRRAQLLGYKNHAEFVLEKRMAESPEKVLAFLERIKVPALKKAKAEIAEITKFAQSIGGPKELMPWDFSYYSEKYKEKLFAFSGEDLRPYFKLENVIEGVFEHARRLYQLTFKPVDGQYPVYHPDVRVFEVYDEKTNEFVGLFYADFFPRESKNGGAWMTNYIEQGLFFGNVRRPHVAIVCNFTKPTSEKPSLLTHDEVLTLFHEFGHSLHGLLSKVKFRSLAGTNVYWDFVELPSQVMENWAYEKESLDLFARHYETGEKIPQELADKLKASSQYLSGYMNVRQLTFGLLDMAWHTTDPSEIKDIDQFEEKHTAELQVLPRIAGTNFSCAFTHIFAGGYSAGYYSYKWAEVLDADTFELFEEKGLFNSEAAQSFKENVLSRGGTEHPMELYKKFRGREPDPDALLRRDGLVG